MLEGSLPSLEIWVTGAQEDDEVSVYSEILKSAYPEVFESFSTFFLANYSKEVSIILDSQCCSMFSENIFFILIFSSLTFSIPLKEHLKARN